MDLVIISRVLRQRWRLAILGLVLSAAIGAVASHRSRGPQFFEATGQVLVDTRAPLIDTTGTPGVISIAQRAIFLADLAASPANTEAIAHAAGLSADEVSIITPQFLPVTRDDTLLPDGELPQLSAKAAEGASAYSYYQVLLDANYEVPQITITATAISSRRATELTRATIAALQSTIRQELASTIAGAHAPPGASTSVRRQAAYIERGIPPAALTITQLGSLRTTAVANSGSHVALAIGAAIGAFGIWSLALAFATRRRAVPRRRRRGRLERAGTQAELRS